MQEERSFVLIKSILKQIDNIITHACKPSIDLVFTSYDRE